MKQFSFLTALICLLFFVSSVDAKVLPQAKGGKQAVTTKSFTGGGIGVTPRLRSDRQALTVYFSNLQNASSVSYLLTYQTATQQEGATGALNLSGTSSTTQELLFGTCSKNVCRYHTGVKNARLEVSYTSRLGKKYLKRYRIKV